MASASPRFIWCACRKHKIPSKDTHELCLHCLGIQHAKEAVLEYGKCPHCAKMDWSTCINRLTKVQEVMHRESQQRKLDSAQSETQAKPETTSVPVSEAKTVQDAICSTLLPHSVAVTPGPTSSTMPVMFTILSPTPAPTDSNATVQGPYMSHVAIQQSADSTPSLSFQNLRPLSSASLHKKKRVIKCHSRCSKHSSNRYHAHRRRCSSSSSPLWSSSDSSCPSDLREKRRRREGHHPQNPKELQEHLLKAVEQKLEAQQQSMQIQWAMLERRLQALEKGEAEEQANRSVPSVSMSAASQAPPQPSTSSQGEEQRDWSGSTSDAVVTGSTPLPPIKQEEEVIPVLLASKLVSSAPEGGSSSSQPEVAISKLDILEGKELQNLIARAASYLGITFPKSSSNPPEPTMQPDFEELLQSTWSNPASSKPFRDVFSEMYRLTESQAPAYNRMPQVNTFMSAIFQAVKPTAHNEQSMPADRWRLTETLAEGIYQTAGMLAKTANYLRYLSDYQQQLLAEITEDHSAQRLVTVINELKLISQFSQRLSSHQAELSGRAMAASVAIRRQVWMTKTNYTDALKATVADLPFVLSQSMSVSSGPSSSADTSRQEQ